VAALAQNGDSLGADQTGAADDDDLHGLLSLIDGERSRCRAPFYSSMRILRYIRGFAK
jgi:hypothetical protein